MQGCFRGPEWKGVLTRKWLISTVCSELCPPHFTSPPPVAMGSLRRGAGLPSVYWLPPVWSGVRAFHRIWWRITWILGIHEYFMLPLNLWYNIWIGFGSRVLYLHNHCVRIFLKRVYFWLYLWLLRESLSFFFSISAHVSVILVDVPYAKCGIKRTIEWYLVFMEYLTMLEVGTVTAPFNRWENWALERSSNLFSEQWSWNSSNQGCLTPEPLWILSTFSVTWKE